MTNRLSVLLLSLLLLFTTNLTRSEGISVDAGLTPGQDRVIVRMQYRNIINKMGDDHMTMHMFPIVVAYGLSPGITVMMRNAYRATGRNETMMAMDNRWTDPFFMAKFKLYRHNTRNSSFGIAAFSGTTVPAYRNSISKTYSPVLGLNGSYRPGYWSFDLNNSYGWQNYNTEEKQAASRQLQINLAVSRNFVVEKWNNLVIAPVQEISYSRNQPETGDAISTAFISPGIQFVTPHFKLESLYQIPINPSGITGMKNGGRWIFGLRFLF